MYKVFIENRPLIITKPENSLEHLPSISSINADEVRRDLAIFLEMGVQVMNEAPLNFIDAIFKDHQKITASGGAVIQDQHLLMIKRLGYWDLPKGKLEMNETSEKGALREVMEECGVQNLSIVSKLPDTFHTYQFREKKILKKTNWYLMRAEGEQTLQPQIEEDITEVRWVPMGQVMELASESYPSLNEVFHHVLEEFKTWNTI